MKKTDRVAVCSRSFSANPILRAELLERYPNASFNDSGRNFAGEELVAFLEGHKKAIVGLETIDGSILSRLPDLAVISKYGVGLDAIDVAAVRVSGKRLGWTPGVNRRSVAELTVAFAIAALRRVPAASREVGAGRWRQHVGEQLTGKTFGIIGCGHIGKDVVRLLEPFSCKVIVNDVLDFPDFYEEHGITPVGLEELLADADVVSLHLPLKPDTRMILDERRLSLLKPTAVLINTARGGLVDESALKKMLASGALAGAAFDVFATEPPADDELLFQPNFLATPHIGGSAREAILAMGRAAIDQLEVDEHGAPGPTTPS